MMRTIDDLPDITFIDDDTYEEILDRMRNNFLSKKQEITGEEETLLPTDDMNIVLNSTALLIHQLNRRVESGLRKNLLKYSDDVHLVGLGMYKNVERILSKKASCLVQFTLSEAQDEDYIISAGTEISKDDVVFYTAEESTIAAGELTKDVLCMCKESGEKGNNIAIGELKTLVKPLPYISKAENIETTYGGQDEESEYDFANRILNSTDGRSVGGTDVSYKYFCKKADKDIKDVFTKTLTKPTGEPIGEIDIALLYSQELQSEYASKVDRVRTYLDENGIRILTDKLNFQEPVRVGIKYKLSYYLRTEDADNAETIKAAVEKAIKEYQDKVGSGFGAIYEEDEIYAILIKCGCKNITKEAQEGYNTIKYKKFVDSEVADFSECILTYKGLTSDITGSI